MLLLLSLACQSADPKPIWLNQYLPDIGLVDVNQTSPSFEQTVSISSFAERSSVWYFGHST